MSDYRDGVVGGKSRNLAALRGALPDTVSLPASVTLPFGCFEEALKAKENKEVKKKLEAAAKKVGDAPEARLAECRQAVAEMALPQVRRSFHACASPALS
jgi:alpha-glucan, water dikinase